MPQSITIRHTSRRPVSRSRRVSSSDERAAVSGSSGSQAFSDSPAEDGWTDLGYSDDDIDPDDSASRSRHRSKHRSAAPAAPAAPRRQSSRRAAQREHSHHRSSSHRVRHRRAPSVESDGVEPYEDYPGHPRGHHLHSHPHHSQGHSNPGWGQGPHHVPLGGFAPSIVSNPGYQANPFANPTVLPPNNMLVPFPQDPYASAGQNPFAPTVPGQPNPFSSPASSSTSSGYFSHQPQGNYHNPMARPGPSGYGGQEIMPYSPGAYYHNPYGPQPYHPPSVHWSYYQVPPTTAPTSSSASTKEAVGDSKKMTDADKIDRLEKLILKQKEEQVEKEKAAAGKAAAEAAAAALVEATKKAREEAEKEAADKAKAAKEGHEKELAEAKAAAHAAKAEAEALKPKEEKHAPIRFKDAVGRKFNFPFHMCKTWKGMEELIKQAFLHVDKIGSHVQEGHYDLMGPNGEIILPAVWDTTIEPDWAITMLMWPLPATPPPSEAEVIPPPPPLAPGHGALVKKSNSRKGHSKSSSKASHSPPMVMVPPPPPPAPGLPPPPGVGSDVVVVEVSPAVAAVAEHGEHAAKSKRSQPIPPLLAWTAGGGGRKGGSSLKGAKKPESGHGYDSACLVM